MGIRFFVIVVLLGLTLSTLDAKSLKGKRIFSKNISWLFQLISKKALANFYFLFEIYLGANNSVDAIQRLQSMQSKLEPLLKATVGLTKQFNILSNAMFHS